MGLRTFLGPILSGTVKNTTGTTAGTVRNTGAGDAFQFGTFVYTTTSASNFSPIMCIPAGAYIENITVDVTTQFNAGTNNTITIQTSGGTALATLTGTSAVIGVGRYTTGVTIGSAVFAIPSGAIPTLLNVGTTD